MKSVKLRKVGNSLGITLPKELLEFNPEFAEWVDAFEKTNNKYKNTLKALSK